MGGDHDQLGARLADPGAELEFPRSVRFGFDYWLSRCEGFRVDCPAGSGTVEEVRFGSRHDRPDALVVRIGRRLGRRRLLVATDEIASLSPRERRIWLTSEAPARPDRPG